MWHSHTPIIPYCINACAYNFFTLRFERSEFNRGLQVKDIGKCRKELVVPASYTETLLLIVIGLGRTRLLSISPPI